MFSGVFTDLSLEWPSAFPASSSATAFPTSRALNNVYEFCNFVIYVIAALYLAV
jgi:hypothetical protein